MTGKPRMHTKPEWALVDSEGKIIARFFRKFTAKGMKYRYEKDRYEKLYVITLEEAKEMKSRKENKQKQGVLK